VARSFLDRWVNRLKASAREEIQETARSVLLYAAGAAACLMSIVFLTLAAFWWLSREFDPIVAALIITAFYAVLAAVLLIWASWGSRAGEAREPTPKPVPAAERQVTANAGDMPAKLGIDLDSVARTLGEAGYRLEGAVVAAGSELVKQLTPLQFVALVFVGSFLFGRRLRRR
jgi:hypothetical protein